MTKEEYIDGILELHADGTIDVYEHYRKESGERRTDETEYQYIIRHVGIEYDNLFAKSNKRRVRLTGSMR